MNRSYGIGYLGGGRKSTLDVTSNLRRWSGKNGGSGGGNGDEIAEYVKIVKSYAEKNKKWRSV